MSEDEAKEKWCPFSRVWSYEGGSFNRDLDGSEAVANCIGSRCMAWRWEDNRRERGFCGMAGKPVVP